MHTVLDDAWRSISQYTPGPGCDVAVLPMEHKWYRFQLNGVDATIPTACGSVSVIIIPDCVCLSVCVCPFYSVCLYVSKSC